MPDFPSVDVVCRVPGSLLNQSYVADLAVVATADNLHLAGVTSPGDGKVNGDVTSDGKTSHQAGARSYYAPDLRLISRAMVACRANITDQEMRAALTLLSERLATLATTAPPRPPPRPRPQPTPPGTPLRA